MIRAGPSRRDHFGSQKMAVTDDPAALLRAMFDALPSRYARGLPVQVVHLKE